MLLFIKHLQPDDAVMMLFLLCTAPVEPSHKSHNALDKCPTMHHFVTEMCTHAHFCYKMVHYGILV